jgi:hypothetical protein
VTWYPRRTHYFIPVADEADIEQGDIFWGVPTLIAAHPAVADQFQPPGELPLPEALEPPPLHEVQRGIRVHADAVMVMPHTCDFYGPEKGRGHRERLVARVLSLRSAGIEHPELLRSGEGYAHTFFLPSWLDPTSSSDDVFVNLRSMTTVDASYLSRARRLACLSRAAVICLRRRLAQFFTDYAPMPSELVEADLRGGLLREGRALISTEELKSVLGEEATARLLRQLYQRPRSG